MENQPKISYPGVKNPLLAERQPLNGHADSGKKVTDGRNEKSIDSADRHQVKRERKPFLL